MKLLVSNNVAGSIIGRQGQTINELQSQSSTRIKLSQAGDYYPGTQDRVCLVQGETEAVKNGLRLLLSRLYQLQEQQNQNNHWSNAANRQFDFVVRLLVPLSCSGMLIGKNGSNIKLMEETTKVNSVRLSPKDNTATAERIVTITGLGAETCLQCCFLILDDMSSHPDVSRYTNLTTSYTRILESHMYSPLMPNPSPRPLMVPMQQSPSGLRQPQPELFSAPQPPPPLWEGFPPVRDAAPVRRIASSPDLPLPMNPISPDPQSRPLYDVVEGGLEYSPAAPAYMVPPTGSHEDLLHHSVSEPDLLALQMEHSMQLGNTGPSPGLTIQTPTMTAPGCFQAQVLVPDSMVGSILGRAGRALNELQMMSGTRIRISQRGEYMPGTRSRIVTIHGPNAQSVWQAQYMMSQRMVLPPTAAYVQHPYPVEPQPQEQHNNSVGTSSENTPEPAT